MPATRSRGSLGWSIAYRTTSRPFIVALSSILPFANGDESWELPIPATFILDRDGTILYASADEDYTQRPEPREILRNWLSPRA